MIFIRLLADHPDAAVRADLVDAALANNFDFRARQIELEQQGFAVRLAQNERYPAVAVSPFYARESADGRETELVVHDPDGVRIHVVPRPDREVAGQPVRQGP